MKIKILLLAVLALAFTGCLGVRTTKSVNLAKQTASAKTTAFSLFKDASILGAVVAGSDQLTSPTGTNWTSTRSLDLSGYTNAVSDQLPQTVSATGKAVGEIANTAVTGR